MRPPELLPESPPPKRGKVENPFRRTLLKAAVGAAAGGAIVAYLGGENTPADPTPPAGPPQPEPEKIPEIKLRQKPTERDRLERINNRKSPRGMRRMILSQLTKTESDPQLTPRFSLSGNAVKEIYQDWEDYYLWGPGSRTVTQALSNLGGSEIHSKSEMRTKLETIFRDVGFPEDFFSIGIVESGFALPSRAASIIKPKTGELIVVKQNPLAPLKPNDPRRRAIGPFQFLLKTAIDYKITKMKQVRVARIINGKTVFEMKDTNVFEFDNRYDTEISGRACAEYLKKEDAIFARRGLTDRTERHKLVLGIYNGSFPRGYRDIKTMMPRQPVTLAGFYSEIERQMNSIMEELSKGTAYQVEQGETLTFLTQKLRRRYNLSKEDLLKHNPGIDSGTLVAGRIIKIPSIWDRTLAVTLRGTLLTLAEELAVPEHLNEPDKAIEAIKLANPHITDWTAAESGPATVRINIPVSSVRYRRFVHEARMRRLEPYIENLDYPEKVFSAAIAVREHDNRLAHRRRAAEQQ